MHDAIKMTSRLAKEITGGLGFPTKLPGSSYGLPASRCITGSKLAKISGSVCSVCYALADRYGTRNVEVAQTNRLHSLNRSMWADAMVYLLTWTHRNGWIRIDMGVRDAKARGIVRTRLNEAGYHRWHDSGDLQSVEHLAKICDVARRTPKIKHWLPTQELGTVRRYLAGGGTVPDNLVIRVSSVMIDDSARRSWPHTSSVFRSGKSGWARLPGCAPGASVHVVSGMLGSGRGACRL